MQNALTEELKEYARGLELDFVGCCSVDRFDAAPEDRRPRVYLEHARSIVSIGFDTGAGF